ncbi:MAG TPA: RsmE family RNA methyltransferase, partial [Patescibacteria group bacterium]|nr:RsmE family RNA methyltransferase [Patescibacteria group bacterium]
LGVHRIVPLLTKRTVGQFSEEDRARKLSKWRLTAIEAIKQSGSAWLPRIEMPLTVEESIAQLKTIDLQLLGSLAEGARHPKIYFEEFAAINARKPRSISVAVGPEGDFTPEELEAFQAAGGRPITLGRLVLRTDTAAVYCLSVINYQLSSP